MGRMSRPHSRTGRQRYWGVFQYPVKTFPNHIPTTTWTTIWSTWVEISQYSGTEIVWPQQVQEQEELTMRCRYFPQVQQIERVVVNGQNYYVIQANDIGNLHQEVELTCAAVDPDQ